MFSTCSAFKSSSTISLICSTWSPGNSIPSAGLPTHRHAHTHTNTMKRVSGCIKQKPSCTRGLALSVQIKGATHTDTRTHTHTHTHTEWHTWLFNGFMADSTVCSRALQDVRGYSYSGAHTDQLCSAFSSYLYSFVFRQESTIEAQQFQLTPTH